MSTSVMKRLLIGACAVVMMSVSIAAAESINTCPVGLVKGLTLDEEFGAGTQENTRCIERRHHLMVATQINQLYNYGTTASSIPLVPYALGNMENIIADYEITSGMQRDRDYEMVAVVSGPAGVMMVNNGTGHPKSNPFQAQVQALMDKGVQFYLCQNTARANGIKKEHLIPGVKYVTAGVTAVVDFQLMGYTYLQP